MHSPLGFEGGGHACRHTGGLNSHLREERGRLHLLQHVFLCGDWIGGSKRHHPGKHRVYEDPLEWETGIAAGCLKGGGGGGDGRQIVRLYQDDLIWGMNKTRGALAVRANAAIVFLQGGERKTEKISRKQHAFH